MECSVAMILRRLQASLRGLWSWGQRLRCAVLSMFSENADQSLHPLWRCGSMTDENCSLSTQLKKRQWCADLMSENTRTANVFLSWPGFRSWRGEQQAPDCISSPLQAVVYGEHQRKMLSSVQNSFWVIFVKRNGVLVKGKWEEGELVRFWLPKPPLPHPLCFLWPSHLCPCIAFSSRLPVWAVQ